MPGVTKEQIQAAREADLFTYLQFHEPGVLKQDGPNFRHKEHDSLVYVTGKRYWYWNSRGRSINALDYLIQIRGYGLVDAVHALVGGEIPQEKLGVFLCPESSYGMAVPLFHDVQTVDGSGISLYAPGFRRTPEYAIYGGSPEPGYG